MVIEIVLMKVIHIKSEPHLRSLRDRNRLYWRSDTGEYTRLTSDVNAGAILRFMREGRLWLRTDGIH